MQFKKILSLITLGLTLCLSFFNVQASEATKDYDYVVTCEGCNDTGMEGLARASVQEIQESGVYRVLVMSSVPNKLRAYRVNATITSSYDYYYAEIHADSIPVEDDLQANYNEIVKTIDKMRTNITVDYDGPVCPTDNCLDTLEGRTWVTSWLTAKYGMPAFWHKVYKRVANKIIKNFMADFVVTVCFGNGECVEFKPNNPLFSTMGWREVDFSTVNWLSDEMGYDGSVGDTDAFNLTGIPSATGTGNLICLLWVRYWNTTADGIYCEFWMWRD